MRKNRRNNNMSMRRRRNNINMMGGEYSMPAPVNDNSMNGPSNMSLNQGQQYADFHKNQHGGSLVGGPYPGIVTEQSLIPANMAASARVAPLNAALNEIRGMSDQAGGRRRRRNTMRKGRKNRKNSRKNRRNTMRKGRKNRKNTMRRNRRRNNMMGGAVLNPASVSAPGLLLPSGLEAKAVSGMNAEWRLAENPRAFAPGV